MEIRQESFPWPKYFTMFFATISIFIVNFIYLHDPWLHPEDYPRHYAIFFSVLFTSLGLIWSWAYIITICTLKKPPKSSKVFEN